MGLTESFTSSHAGLQRSLRLLSLFILLILLWPHALGQESISLNSSRSGNLAADELYRSYLLELPAGLGEVTIWVDGGGLDIDLAVNYGAEIPGYNEEDADFIDTSLEVYPFYTISFPRNGRYYIDVVNLIDTAMAYTLHVTTDAAALHALRENSCRWAYDGECDEPGTGTGACSAGTDTYDCSQAGAPPVEEVIRAAPSVTVQPLAVQPGETVTVSYTGAPGNARDWIGIYRAGGGEREFLAYQYLSGNRSGSLSFTAPQEPGRYDFRMFENDSYTRLATSGGLEVVMVTPATLPTTPTLPPGGATVTVSPGPVLPGSRITVSYAGAPGNTNDWLGLYRVGSGDREHITWQYLQGNRSGRLEFVAPQEAGRYDFRLFENNGYTRLATSSSLEVAAHAAPPAVTISCEQQANRPPLAELEVGSLTVTCPACPATGRLWGTGTYTDDSWVCLAARHSGMTGTSGGTFELSILGGRRVTRPAPKTAWPPRAGAAGAGAFACRLRACYPASTQDETSATRPQRESP